jgi:class 3 adenylate cyclase/tetratricopeptide (TPR) repeat protein
MNNCIQCQHENPPGAKFCNNCGAPQKVSQKAKKALQKEGSELAGKQPQRRAERRQLTILFCDLVDSTRLSEQLDPEEYRQVILDYHQEAESVINQFGGHVGNYLGDGLLAYFGYPEGLEDAPVAGVRAGLGILQAISRANKNWEANGKTVIRIRIGIHTGLAVVDEHLALGETVNIAARLEGLAPHNGLVISPKTLKLVQGWVEFKSIGEHKLKGISDPMEVFQVLGESGAKTRLEVAKSSGLTPLVGREQELKNLIKYWSQAKKKKGQAVLVNGEAGIGKSRLVDSIKEHVADDSGSYSIEARCSSYHQNSAFYPILELFEKDLLKINSSDRTEDKLRKLENLISKSGLEAEQLSLVAEFLSIPTEKYPPLLMSAFAKRSKLMQALIQCLFSSAETKPMLLVVEDLHWADASTLEWLKLLFKELQGHGVLILCTTRPGLSLDWITNSKVEQITLNRLAADDIAAICLYQTKGKKLPKEILDQIATKTEGVPLFVEELTKMIMESDFLVEKDHGFELSGVLSSLSIPSTLQDSLLSRLDRLSNIREVVHVGSVLGREFSFEMLAAVLPRDPEILKQSLARLMEAELITPKAVDQQALYQFKHALIQDTAYESMLKSRRKQLHQRTADVLKNKFQNISQAQPELLAHHLTEAGSFQKAIPLWLAAGQSASKQNATSEAIAHLEKGIGLLDHIESETDRNSLELDFRLTLGGTFVVSHGFPHPKVKETFDQAREIAQGMKISPKLALIQLNLLSYYFNTEDYNSVEELRDHMMILAKHPVHGNWFELFANHLGSLGVVVKGEFEQAIRGYHRSKELFDPSLPFPWELTPSGYYEVCAKAWGMVCYQILGYKEQAKSLCDKHLDYTKDHHDSMTLYHIYTFPALYHLLAREWKSAESAIEIYLPIVKKFGDPVFTLTAEVYYYVAKAFQGDEEAFDTAVNLINICFEVGFKAFAVTLSSFIAEQYYQVGKYEAGLAWIEKILEHVDITGTHIQTAELNRIKALILQAMGESDALVLKSLMKALDVSRTQSAKTFELRAATDLARLKQKQGKPKDAYKLLAPVYQWFDEGLDSVDLKDTKTVLDELKAETLSQ